MSKFSSLLWVNYLNKVPDNAAWLLKFYTQPPFNRHLLRTTIWSQFCQESDRFASG